MSESCLIIGKRLSSHHGFSTRRSKTNPFNPRVILPNCHYQLKRLLLHFCNLLTRQSLGEIAQVADVLFDEVMKYQASIAFLWWQNLDLHCYECIFKPSSTGCLRVLWVHGNELVKRPYLVRRKFRKWFVAEQRSLPSTCLTWWWILQELPKSKMCIRCGCHSGAYQARTSHQYTVWNNNNNNDKNLIISIALFTVSADNTLQCYKATFSIMRRAN